MITRKSTNDELKANEAIYSLLQSGNVVVLDKVTTSNSKFTSLFVAGIVEHESSSSLSIIARRALKWGDNNAYIARAILNADTEFADELNVGDVIPDAVIRIVDDIEPAYDGQNAREDRNGVVYTHNGDPIYRSHEVVAAEELATTMPHIILKRDPKGFVASPKEAVSVESLVGA